VVVSDCAGYAKVHVSSVEQAAELGIRCPAVPAQLPAIRRAVAEAARDFGAVEEVLLQINAVILLDSYLDNAAGDARQS